MGLKLFSNFQKFQHDPQSCYNRPQFTTGGGALGYYNRATNMTIILSRRNSIPIDLITSLSDDRPRYPRALPSLMFEGSINTTGYTFRTMINHFSQQFPRLYTALWQQISCIIRVVTKFRSYKVLISFRKIYRTLQNLFLCLDPVAI